MTVAVDYYDLLGLDQSAPEDAIRESHKRQTRIWTKRTASADQSTRQEAETKTALLREAFETLLDADRRRAYDRQLATKGVATPSVAHEESLDWVTQARDALARGDYHTAAYAAREATHTMGNAPEAWIIRSRANAGLGNLHDALYEAKQAITIAPNSADFHFQYGAVQEELKQWTQALSSYQVAARLAPGEFVYKLAIGSVYLQNGLPDEALSTLEPVLAAHPGVDIVNYYVASALLDKAETVPQLQAADSYVVTSDQEIVEMRKLLDRAAKLPTTDNEIADRIDDMRAYLDRMSEMQ